MIFRGKLVPTRLHYTEVIVYYFIDFEIENLGLYILLKYSHMYTHIKLFIKWYSTNKIKNYDIKF